MINYLLLVSRQGKLRLAKWYATMTPQVRTKLVREISQLVLAREQKMCNFLEYKGRKVVYRRYASLFFICEIDEHDNELITLEVLHRYVEQLDQYFGNVCEIDLIYNFQQAYAILDEVIVAGEIQDSSKQRPLKMTKEADAWESHELLVRALKDTHLA